jgi:L-threonylcarbamoyladenylate synthase
MALTGNDISKASELLRNGRLVAIPTETVYGLAANALDEKAVLSIFTAKSRPSFDPLIVHVDSYNSAFRYASCNNSKLMGIMRTFWPGPLTVLMEKKSMIPGLVTSGLNTVAIRVPSHRLTLQLLRQVQLPLAAPSANPFGYVSPTRVEHVEKQLGDKIDYILDGGPCDIGVESTILSADGDKIIVHRLGGLPLEEIEKVSGPVEMRINQSGNPLSPGQLKSHYSPTKPLFTGDLSVLLQRHKGKKISVIAFGPHTLFDPNLTVYNLSPTGDLHEAALNLFNYIRLADEDDSDVVIAAILPETGMGRAINDRLLRAGA